SSLAKTVHVFRIVGQIFGQPFDRAGKVVRQVVTRDCAGRQSSRRLFSRLSLTRTDFVTRLALATLASRVRSSSGNLTQIVRISVSSNQLRSAAALALRSPFGMGVPATRATTAAEFDAQFAILPKPDA